MKFAEFVRLYPFRAKNIAWLFGAGTSVAAGLPSAYDLIWDFKKRIYCSEQNYSIKHFSNLSDKGIRQQISQYFENSKWPEENSPEEYAILFESAFPSSRSRQEYIMQMTKKVQLTYGHKALGVLLKHGFVQLIFTTNFDKAIENIAVEQYKNSDDWFCATLDTAALGLSTFQSNSPLPLIVKLHGDYQSENLKNTTEELKQQDANLRQILTVSSYTKGLAIMGYSGRDSSIMETLTYALNQEHAFPHGLFWFIRSGTEPLPAVTNFIDKAREKKIESAIIEIETFDTAWADIIKGFDNIPQEDLDTLNKNYFRLTPTNLPHKGKNFPLIRLNAITIKEFPATARLLKCNVGNTKEIKDLIQTKKGDLIAIRKRDGVVGFGPDKEFERVFANFESEGIDIYSIPGRSLYYEDSSLKELITDAISRALVRDKPLINIKRKQKNLIIPNHKSINDSLFNEIKLEFGGKIMGNVTHSNSLKWIICLELSIQQKLDTSFLLLNPNILVTKTSNEDERKLIAPFVKEFTATWYNNKYDSILTQWIKIFFGNNKELNLQTFSNIEGVNARFLIEKTTAYSKSL